MLRLQIKTNYLFSLVDKSGYKAYTLNRMKWVMVGNDTKRSVLQVLRYFYAPVKVTTITQRGLLFVGVFSGFSVDLRPRIFIVG